VLLPGPLILKVPLFVNNWLVSKAEPTVPPAQFITPPVSMEMLPPAVIVPFAPLV
jgi:hypothetical protein